MIPFSVRLDTPSAYQASGDTSVKGSAGFVGGVAGYSDGSLLGCVNHGTVGYQHIGYNVGGIVGRSSGNLSACVNHGSVYGRREVGGVAGMAEPYVHINLKGGSLDEIREQVRALSRVIDKAADDASTTIYGMPPIQDMRLVYAPPDFFGRGR